MRISDWSSDVCSSDLFTPKRKKTNRLGAGEVGWINASIKDVHGAPVGDTLTHAGKPADHAFPGFQTLQDRKGGVLGKGVAVRVDPGGCRVHKKKKTDKNTTK